MVAHMIRIECRRARAVCVPMIHPHQTASWTVSESPLVLIDVVTDQGAAGHSIVFTCTAAALKPTAELVHNLASLVEGEALAPAAIAEKLARRLLGTQGLIGMALAGIDMALWGALARVHNVSLVSLLGGSARPVPAYGAVGYDGEIESARVAEELVRQGLTGIKAKIGYPMVAEDLAVIRAIRSASGHNQSLTPSEAVERLRQVEDEASPGSWSRLWRTITRAMRALPARFAPPFSAARTGGVCATCNTPSRRAPAII